MTCPLSKGRSYLGGRLAWGMTSWLRRLGQYIGLIYREDGSWRIGRGTRSPPCQLTGSIYHPHQPYSPNAEYG
jgi:hypothetical protein